MKTQGAVARYTIDKRASRFTVKAFAGGMLSAFGHNPVMAIRDLDGEVSLAPDAPGQSSLTMRIRAGSLEVTGDIGSKDRREMEGMMNDDVLEVSKYPEILYESPGGAATQIGEGRYRIDMNGSLTLHGVKRGQPVSAQVTINGGMLRASGEFSLLQTDYGIKPVNAMGGTLKVKDELKFTFDIVARHKE
jgi:polyisoprenoid-binding protein YceI